MKCRLFSKAFITKGGNDYTNAFLTVFIFIYFIFTNLSIHSQQSIADCFTNVNNKKKYNNEYNNNIKLLINM